MSSYPQALSSHFETVLTKRFSMLIDITGSTLKNYEHLDFQPIIFNTSEDYSCLKCKSTITVIINHSNISPLTTWNKFKASFR